MFCSSQFSICYLFIWVCMCVLCVWCIGWGKMYISVHVCMKRSDFLQTSPFIFLQSEVLRFECQVFYWLLSPWPSFLYVIMTNIVFFMAEFVGRNFNFVSETSVSTLSASSHPSKHIRLSEPLFLIFRRNLELMWKPHMKRLWKAHLQTRHLYHTPSSSRDMGIVVEGGGCVWKDCRSQRLLKTRTQCFLSQQDSYTYEFMTV